MRFCLLNIRLPGFGLRDKFDWLYQPPFLFANANNPEVCRKFLQLYSETPRIQHSRVTLYLIDTFGEHMEEIANGNVSVCNAEYSRELAVWDRMPLTSDPAEGYHRSTKLSKTRAHYSKMPWLISSNSLKQNLEFAYEEINSGDGGERVLSTRGERGQVSFKHDQEDSTDQSGNLLRNPFSSSTAWAIFRALIGRVLARCTSMETNLVAPYNAL